MGDLLFLAGAQILSGNMDNAVGVDIKGYLDLRNAAGSSGDTVHTELAQELVIFCEFTFALEDTDLQQRSGPSAAVEKI